MRSTRPPVAIGWYSYLLNVDVFRSQPICTQAGITHYVNGELEGCPFGDRKRLIFSRGRVCVCRGRLAAQLAIVPENRGIIKDAVMVMAAGLRISMSSLRRNGLAAPRIVFCMIRGGSATGCMIRHHRDKDIRSRVNAVRTQSSCF